MLARHLYLLFFVLLAACANAPPPAQAPAPTAAACSGSSLEAVEDALPACSHVFGDLRIENSQLTDLSALTSVRSVSGTLFIGGNQRLTSLAGLEQLRSVGHVVVVNNPLLRDVSGLSGLVEARAISILDNPRLMALFGPESPRHLDGLVIAGNARLINVNGFSGLVSAGDVVIADNPALIHLSGLADLSFVDNLHLENNPRLAPTPDLFRSLVSVNDALFVARCPGLGHGDSISPERSLARLGQTSAGGPW